MKLLHTADWHIGKTLKGRNRLDEQRQVIAQIIGVARDQQPDAVLIAGDLYDMSARRRRRSDWSCKLCWPCGTPAHRSLRLPETMTAQPLSMPTGR